MRTDDQELRDALRSKDVKRYSALHRERRIARDPCHEEKEMVFNCYNENYFDRSKCELEIENVRACKKFWNRVKWHRFFHRITPAVPEPEDRERVKQEYSHYLAK